MTSIETQQVAIEQSRSALSLLHNLCLEAKSQFAQVFDQLSIPQDIKSFRNRYDTVIAQFEALRIGSDQRLEIAQFLVLSAGNNIVWQTDAESSTLQNFLLASGSTKPAKLSQRVFAGKPGWHPAIEYRGEQYAGQNLGQLSQVLLQRNIISPQAATALQNIVVNLLEDELLSLENKKIVMLGAGAEMAPTRQLLAAGADVLWVDPQPPPQEWHEAPSLSGRLFIPDQPLDLLTNPDKVLATILEFAQHQQVDIGLFAYAPGKARELRLTASMNAIVDALPEQMVGSIVMLVSPTTPTQLDSHDLQQTALRLANRPWWEAVCAACGLLKPQHLSTGKLPAVTNTVVQIQGASYQMAQYICKTLTAEVWAGKGMRVSANTAAISRTRSLAHPVFAAAFGGAEAFGVETMTPEQSRGLNGLLAFNDILGEQLPELGSVRVHGGIHTLPYSLGSALRIAAAIGFVRSPKLLRGLFG